MDGAKTYCGYCWKYPDLVDVPCEDPCKMKGGMCSDTQPKPGYQIIDKCVGISGGAEVGCGYCWKNTVTPCTSRVCDLKGGKCSPTSPGKGWQVSGTCETKDCFCWTSRFIIGDLIDLEPLELAP
ncbi:uncharacterized protein LOC111704469 [Eurytemora carolleeae]|uniref:uncharacterized protein LOC111704469 n=1 Tax=Eurytemora carolleeae TaxID=1294199 RepID=UPI000C7865AA|nr:uncharacterized protein LOC111704469 [Eurytemora carolleeae]|eukprot:XP_023332477.1 uncharacterized protein LOC111704469 [Eurytemora affinis]